MLKRETKDGSSCSSLRILLYTKTVIPPLASTEPLSSKCEPYFFLLHDNAIRALVKSKLIFRRKVIPPDPTNSNKRIYLRKFGTKTQTSKTKLAMTDWQKTTTETGVKTKVISG